MRLKEQADEVLAALGIDAGLAADGGIDLRQQARRHLHHMHATADDAGSKAGKIADDAATQGDDNVAALEPCTEDGIDDALQNRETLRLFSRLDNGADGGETRLGEAVNQGIEMMSGNILVGNDHRPRARQQASDLSPGVVQ